MIRSRVGFAPPKALLIVNKFCCILKTAGAILLIAAKNKVRVATERSALLNKNWIPAIKRVINSTEASKIYLLIFIK